VINKLGFILRRILFFGALLLGGVAALEKLFNFFGYTLLRGYYTPWRLLEFAAIALIFVIVMQLWEIRILLTKKE
jgi:hypothetical protein